MKLDQSDTCPHCGRTSLRTVKSYSTVHNGVRRLYECGDCRVVFSETRNTPAAHVKTPLSKIAGVLKVRSEGPGQRATGRIFGIHKNTVKAWETKFAAQKAPLMLYAVCHEFIRLTFEGDELYTITGRRGEVSDSEGWTAVVMERASRFIADMRCGKKDARMFEAVMSTIAGYAAQSGDISFFSDGERRYGNILFELCAEVLRTGRPGRPVKTFPPGMRVRLKNKGAQKSKPGRKRSKYETPHREHPQTQDILQTADIHANHAEAHNAALRRRCSAFRRRTNLYAKSPEGLQRVLDVYQIIHNFIRPHWTTGQVPAVALGVVAGALRLEDVLTARFV